MVRKGRIINNYEMRDGSGAKVFSFLWNPFLEVDPRAVQEEFSAMTKGRENDSNYVVFQPGIWMERRGASVVARNIEATVSGLMAVKQVTHLQ